MKDLSQERTEEEEDGSDGEEDAIERADGLVDVLHRAGEEATLLVSLENDRLDLRPRDVAVAVSIEELFPQ